VNTKDDILKVFVYTINVNGVQKNFFQIFSCVSHKNVL